MTTPRPIALTLAGADPTSGAGLQADLRVWTVWGIYGLSVVTAVTSQDGRRVHRVWPLSREQVQAQLEAVARLPLAVVKCGMLGSREVVELVSDFLEMRSLPVVLDPVLEASDGTPLLDPKAREVLIRRLLPRITVITPNLPEAACLTGRCDFQEDPPLQLLRDLHSLGPQYVLLTGGHRPGDPVDFLYDGKEIHSFPGTRVPGEIHGTGCVLAASLAAALALGEPLPQAFYRVRQWMEDMLQGTLKLGEAQVLPGFPRD